MVLKTPNTLDQLILYWWKIIDRPQISRDELQNFIAFELFTLSLEETKHKIQQAIDQKLLQYDPLTEILQLRPSLQTEFEAWKNEGVKKTKKMLEILRKPWRKPIEFDEKDYYNIYYHDLVDPTIDKRTSNIMSSAIELQKLDFNSIITGKINGFPFEINLEEKRIVHRCPDFTPFRIQEKSFCPHLARLIMKLNFKNKDETLKLLKKIVQNKNFWEFSNSFK
ncbi:MAG: hypothetical protein DRO88_04645 [Promethearchaeia archaeon]|nr:MAG: hypothetical protein DRO88_04645 [Candidatus Lokiarchaeia archaeon]